MQDNEKFRFARHFPRNFQFVSKPEFVNFPININQVFATLNEKYEAYELDQRDDGAAIQAALAEITGAKTVPRVFVKGECLGGGSDVKKLFEDGDLQKKL